MIEHQLDFSLRYFSGGDWKKAVVEVEDDCHEPLPRLLGQPDVISFGLVAEDDATERPIGFVLVLDGEIIRLAVSPIFRRMGVGAELVRAAARRSRFLSGARLHSARVPDLLLDAHHFFNAMGFIANRPSRGDDTYLFSLARKAREGCTRERRGSVPARDRSSS